MARNIEFNEATIISKAQKVFWKQGYHGTSMQDLVKATGLNPGSLYNTFGSKHDLFLLCLKDYTKPVQDFDPSAKSDKDALRVLKSYIRAVAINGTKTQDACLSAKACFELAAADADVHKASQCTMVKALANLEQLIVNAQQANSIRKDLDAAAVAQLINATLSGLGPNFIIFKDRKRIDAVLDNLFMMLTS
ncbi:MAG: TetR/AcrR family transcriptional regulator [Chitinophagaceae bacterium]|nr:MAG: TetR/AcrR family transcriptional regulator [Chitinophagaceae bacterium]